MGNILSGVCCTCDPSCTADPSVHPPNTEKKFKGNKVSDNLLNMTQEGNGQETKSMLTERPKEKNSHHTQFRFQLNDQPMSVTPESSRMTQITKSESTLSRHIEHGDDDSLNIQLNKLEMSPRSVRSVIINGDADNSIPDIPEVSLQTNKITSANEPPKMDGTINLAEMGTIHGNLQSHNVHPIRHTQISGQSHNTGHGQAESNNNYQPIIPNAVTDHHAKIHPLPNHKPLIPKPRSKANLFRDQTDRVWDESDMEDLEEEMKAQMDCMSQLITPSAATPHTAQTPIYTPHQDTWEEDNSGSEVDNDNEEYMNATSTMKVTHLDIDRRGSNLVQTSSCDWDSSELEKEEDHIKKQINHLKSTSDINSSQ